MDKKGIYFLILIFIGVACSNGVEKPEPGSETYAQAVSDFYVSLSAMQADQGMFAVQKMDSLAKAYPEEAAFWANLAVFAMRQGNFEEANAHISKALNKDANNSDIMFLSALIKSRQGEVSAAIEKFREATKTDPKNIKISFALAEELQRQDNQSNADEVISLLESILNEHPNNLAVMLETVRTSVKWNNKEQLNKALKALDEQSDNWPEATQQQFAEFRSAIDDSESNTTFQLAFLRNSLAALPKFQSDLAAVQLPPNQIGFLVTEFSWFKQPTTAVAPPDTGLTFSAEPHQSASGMEVTRLISLTDDGIPDRLSIDDGKVIINDSKELSFPGEPQSPYASATLDYNYDFLNDIVVAGSDGLKLYQQQQDSTLADVTNSLSLSAAITSGNYYGVWRADVDLDGDLDLLLSRQQGALQVLRNNGDSTFQPVDILNNVENARDFAWTDLDGDSDGDAVFINASGSLSINLNERAGNFRSVNNLLSGQNTKAITASDINNDSVVELLVWSDSDILQVRYSLDLGEWETTTVASVPESFNASNSALLFSVDLDNNGANDVIISSKNEAGYWLNSSDSRLNKAYNPLPAGVADIADLDGDSRLDLVGLDNNGKRWEALNEGTKDYKARIIRPRASGPQGDRRINSFGIGGQVEIRSGLLYEKQLITQPWVHLGLGTYDEAKILRIIWPNGSSQTEFAELGYGSKILNEQILKGSCPWVFTNNGEEMEFVTDFIWRTGLGIRINAQGASDVMHSVDWIKLDGDQLQSVNGKYDVRITADLWETHYFDHIALKAVDHPIGTEVFVDERFTAPPRMPELITVNKPQPVKVVIDQDGRDVTQQIRVDDNKFVDSFQRTQYQGLAKDHYVEVRLPDDLPTDQPVRLIALGWVYPTDTSINIAIAQGKHKAPKGVRLEVPDRKGGWKVVKKDIGFPSGKSKTMMIDLTNIFEPGTERKVRLATNMEIYWNQIRWATEQSNKTVRELTTNLSSADLRYRGFSKVSRSNRFIPERPNYQKVSGTTPMWYDLKGFYTRFGAVDELVTKTDDRYVIMNAGDELALSFESFPSPREGMKRDYVLVGDGWIKDGDYNSGYSSTVIPLPYHGMEDYSRKPTALQDDPVFKKHSKDWINYHTRYITPKSFQTALKFDE